MSRKVEKALCDGETVELPNQGWRKGKFYDYETEGKTLRILCVEIKGGKALVQLGKLEKDRYPKAGYFQSNYTTVAALGLKGAGASPPKGYMDRMGEDAEARNEDRRRQQLQAERKDLKTRLATTIEMARERGVDIRSDVRVIERRLKEIDKKLSDGPATSSVASVG